VRIAVRDKMGVGILIRDAVNNAIERGEFKVLRVPELVLETKSFIVHRKERPLSPAARDFLALLKEKKPKARESETNLRGGSRIQLKGRLYKDGKPGERWFASGLHMRPEMDRANRDRAMYEASVL
jgi:hypothetical protein